jgi:hypothetical protein
MHCSGIVKWDGRYVFLKPHQGKDGAERKSTRSPRSEVTHTWPSPPISIQRLICVWAAVCTKTPPRRGLRETWRYINIYDLYRLWRYLRVKRNTPPQIGRASDNARSSAQKVNFILRPSCCHSQHLINCPEEHLVADGQRRQGRTDCNNNGSHPCYGLRSHGTHRKSLKNDSTSSLPVMQELSIAYRSPIYDLTAIGDWSHRSIVRRCGISPE